MTTLLLTIFIFIVAFLGMGLGVIFRGSALRGSCGGVMMSSGESEEESCSICGRGAVDSCRES